MHCQRAAAWPIWDSADCREGIDSPAELLSERDNSGKLSSHHFCALRQLDVSLYWTRPRVLLDKRKCVTKGTRGLVHYPELSTPNVHYPECQKVQDPLLVQFAKRVCPAVFCAVVLCVFSRTVHAQSPTALISGGPASELDSRLELVPTSEELTEKQTQLAARIKLLQLSISSVDDGSVQEWLAKSYEQELAHLEFLQLIYQQTQTSLDTSRSLSPGSGDVDSELERIHDRMAAASEFATFLEVERIRSAVELQRGRVETLAAEIEAVGAAKISISSQLHEADRTRRQLRESYDPDDNSLEMRKLGRRIVITQLSATISKAQLASIILDVDQLKQRLVSNKERLVVIEKILAACPSDLKFTADDLAKQIRRIESRESELRSQLVDVRQQSELQEQRFEEESENLQPDQLIGMLVVRERLQEYARLRSGYLSATLSEMFDLRFCWQSRFELSQKKVAAAAQGEIAETVKATADRLKASRILVGRQLEEARHQRVELMSRLQGGDALDPTLRRWLDIQLSESAKVFDQGTQRLGHIDTAEQLVNRVAAAFDSQTVNFDQESSWSGLQTSLMGWWNYELFAVDDRPITLGKLSSALLMLLGGLFVSRRASRLLVLKIFKRFGLQEGGSHALQTILFYGLCLLFGFLTLELLNIPLTVFAFLGGAAAIAIGFGSQTLLNNFMSGLILMVEQPVRVGDLVEIDGIQGNIKNIGARSTRIHTGENLEIIVPNSTFVEQRLTNWTLSNTQIRTMIKIGVAYGSPTETVTKVLESALRECSFINRSPKPFVLLSDFGANALEFEVYFWIQMRNLMDARRAESRVRQYLDGVLRENQITIAFPQRDVHLDVRSPINVSLSKQGDSESERGSTDSKRVA